ncbi:MAG TPA: xanthine dehydrogenase family protein molybdopterin-binding subunit [Verrucomicrobiae bacterium]|jgi:xanthine dehydrogenase YagR molybdenum-binding subunit|nr:xanthine dehydrogenase family protein molybdopterin-binding subunit [Verrucomicrobiae bacterium]
MNKAVGAAVDRVDGRAKVTGAARFAGDFRQDRMACAVIVPSAVARGEIDAVQTAAARKIPGVLLVLTRENLPALHLKPPGEEHPYTEALTSLIDGKISYAGQAVALVVAETLEQAQEGAAAVHVRYREDTPALQMNEADPQAVFPKESHGEKVQYVRGKMDEALTMPGMIKVDAAYFNPVETHNPMEPAVTLAWWDHDHLNVYDATRWLVGTQATLADVFRVAKENVHVMCPLVGGAFGSKAFRWSHTVLAAAAARMLDRPVRLELTRAQMFTWMGHRPESRQKLTLVAGPDGRLIAMRHDTSSATSPTHPFVAPSGVVSKMLYAAPAAQTTHKILPVNRATPTYMRAPAEAPGMFALECAMDELAEAARLDPLELRLRNHADIDPATGRLWSSKNLKACYEIGAEKFGWKQRPLAPRAMTDHGLLVGWGLATATYPGHRRGCAAAARITANGKARVQSSAHEIGNGALTVLAQAAADAIGWPLERVTFELGDTTFPEGPPAGGSVTTASLCDAIDRAVRAAQTKLMETAATLPGTPFAGAKPEELATAEGKIFRRGHPAQGLSYEEILRGAGMNFVEAEAEVEETDLKTKGFTIQSFGAHFCEVKVDPALAQARVTRFVSALDIGRVMNPKTARSQALGGIVMGLGMALTEETIYDPRTGRPVNDNFSDYKIPVNADLGAIDVHFLDRIDPCINTLGCRGAGELPMTGVTAAVVNALWHATGRRVRDLPVTPDKLI